MVVTLMGTIEDMEGGKTYLCWAWHRDQLEVMGAELKFPVPSL